MGLPTYKVEIGFTAGAGVFRLDSAASTLDGTMTLDGPDVGTVWTDVTADVQAIDITHGRQTDLARYEAARAAVILNNESGNYSPENTAGAYYPNVRPMKTIRITGQLVFTFNLFSGRIQRWTPKLSAGSLSTMVLDCMDLSIALARHEISGALPSETTGARIDRVLTEIGFLGDRILDTGALTLAAVTLDKVTALDHILDIVEVEAGQLITQYPPINGQVVVFEDRNSRLVDTRSIEVQETFGGTGIGFRALDYDYAVDEIRNDIRITREGGVEQISSDGASIDEFGRRTHSATSEHYLTDEIAKAHADWMLGHLRDLAPRFRAITYQATLGDAGNRAARAAVRLGAGDRIRVINDELSVDRHYYIEGVSHRITSNVHLVTYYITAAESIGVLVLDDTVRGMLDSEYGLGF